MSVYDPQATLHQIQDAGRHLQTICTGKTLEQLLADWQATAALERFIEIVGEGVKRLPMELRSRHPSVPWKEIAGTRDRLSHGYDDVDYQVLWDAVQKDVPVLLATVEQMLKEIEILRGKTP
jgi:uncharacterized protein with HEPN domain